MKANSRTKPSREQNMSLKEVQLEVDEWVSQYKIGYFKPHEILVRLMEETGELAWEVNHRYGPKPKKSSEDAINLADEMGDIIFTITCLANSLEIDLDAAFSRAMDKCYGRDSERWEKKSSQPTLQKPKNFTPADR